MRKTITSFQFLLFLLVTSICLIQCASEETGPIYPEKIIQLQPEKAAALSQQIRKEVAAKVIDGLELSLWASDSLVTDPVAISMDPQGGIYYTSGTRLEHSEFDIRGFTDWMTASISFQSVEDRRNFLRTTLAPEKSEENTKVIEDLNEDGNHDWRDLLVEKETIWRVSDQSGDGIADQAQLYIEDFNEEITDLANGIEYHDGEVFIAVGPDLWRTKDVDGDGIADQKESISHGYAVHIGFGAHGMSGAIMGPDGRLWWGIGDIGMNVVDKEGKRWKYPNQGVIVRSELDGSNFEVFAAGLRNTHEFVFDQFGNLITEDNDGDHEGERERLVYITEGSDSGWRSNWQYGKYTDPDNNGYKVWMDEKLSIPRWEGQAAYITPPIQNYVNGPTGMLFNPGTALSQRWANHFFIAEFRGSPSNSPIHAFTLKPKGASFELDTTMEIVSGLLPTGLDWGPDGALYFGDWIEGWGVKEAGRLWKLDVPGGENSILRNSTKKLIQADFSSKPVEFLSNQLANPDMRVRQKSQFELVKRGAEGWAILKARAAQASNNDITQLARIHGLWGMGQLARKEANYGKEFVSFLADEDPEIQAQAAKLIGDIRYTGASDELKKLLKHPSLRVQFFAAEALGRTADTSAVAAIIDLLARNNDADAWLRHGAILALSRIGQVSPLIALKNHPSIALRTAAVVALRRLKHPSIALFLADKSEYIVAEVARAINDDFSIPEALPALADLLIMTSFASEPIIRRAINANLRVGKEANINHLVSYATKKSAPAVLRAEAIETLRSWGNPSVLDRVDGRVRSFTKRTDAPVKKALTAVMASLINDQEPSVQIAALRAVSNLQLEEFSKNTFTVMKKAKQADVRVTALQSLATLKNHDMQGPLEVALADSDDQVRSTALGLLSKADIPEKNAVTLFANILEKGTVPEQQATYEALSKLKGADAIALLDRQVDQLNAGTLSKETRLDLLDAVHTNKDASLVEKIKPYEAKQNTQGLLAGYIETLHGGNRQRGQDLFYRHAEAQCIRCHTIWEWGGDAGPVLEGIGAKRSPEDLLTSLIAPSEVLSLGYGVVTLELNDGATLAGIVQEETPEAITIKIGKEDTKTIPTSSIKERENIPSSMPGVKEILSKKEIRDMVAFLVSLKE